MPQRRQRGLVRIALHLDKIGLGHLEAGVGYPRLQAAIVGQQQQSLAVEVEPARRIEAGTVDIGGQRRPGPPRPFIAELAEHAIRRSEEHTSELQSLMRISYAVFCLKKKKQKGDRQT